MTPRFNIWWLPGLDCDFSGGFQVALALNARVVDFHGGVFFRSFPKGLLHLAAYCATVCHFLDASIQHTHSQTVGRVNAFKHPFADGEGGGTVRECAVEIGERYTHAFCQGA